MGNSPLTSLRLSNGDHSISYHVKLGESAAIHFEQEANSVTTRSWKVSYEVGMSTCNLTLTKTKGNTNSPHPEIIKVKIADGDRGNSMIVKTRATSNTDTNATSISLIVSDSPMEILTTATPTAQRKFDLYENKRRRGLMVSEWKKRCEGDKNAYMRTVTHYYADKEKDVGLSLAIKRLRVSDDGHLDFAVEGPQQHPVRALFYMFDEVDRTRTWKPTDCPHCPNNIIQWQLASFEQSESEDSDDRPNSGGIVANNGRFEGNYNGNLIVRNLIVIKRH